MSVNCSSSSNSSLHPSSLCSSVSFYYFMHKCVLSSVGSLSITAFTVPSLVLLLPVCISVLRHGCRRRRRGSAAAASHSDAFTFHMVAVELLNCSALALCCCGIHAHLPLVTGISIYMFSINLYGQLLLHLLTCVERYLAVVHPLTYMNVRNKKRIQIRNISICFCWLLCLQGPGFIAALDKASMLILLFFFLSSTLLVICFCSLSVLCVLVRPGPSEGAGSRLKVDQSKLRAFHTITVILGVQLLKFGGQITMGAVFGSTVLRENEQCAVWLSVIWLNLPCSLVLPLLMLKRAGKLMSCKNHHQSGRGSS